METKKQTSNDSMKTKDLENTEAELLQLLSSFTQEEFNAIPFAGSWTAGQLAEHVLKASKGTLRTIQGKTEATARKPDAKASAINETFLNFNIKFTAPDAIKPADGEHEKTAFLQELNTTLTNIVETSQKLDLSETCLDFELPGFGPFTRLEWLAFINAHTARHVYQLKKIRERLNSKTAD